MCDNGKHIRELRMYACLAATKQIGGGKMQWKFSTRMNEWTIWDGVWEPHALRCTGIFRSAQTPAEMREIADWIKCVGLGGFTTITKSTESTKITTTPTTSTTTATITATKATTTTNLTTTATATASTAALGTNHGWHWHPFAANMYK